MLTVNSAAGNDATADGSDRAPFKTITQALQVAPPGAVIMLAPGTYSQETGETFPLHLKPDVTLQGNSDTRGQDIVIQGSGQFLSPTFARQKITILGADRAILAGVTVKNPDPQGYGVWIESTSPAVVDSTFVASGHDGISVTGSGSPLIRNNYFYQNGANGITIYGTSRAEVRENIFEQTGFAININQKAAPLIVGNRITQNKDGIVVQASAQPVLRNNSVDGNQRDGLVAIARSRPDLGTAGAPGGNSFRNNGQFDVNAKGSSQQIPAFGNDLDKTTGNLDLAGSSPPGPASSSGVPMPWSSSASPTLDNRRAVGVIAAQLIVSSDKSTTAGNGKRIFAAMQKPTVPVSTAATAPSTQPIADTISFGQQLGNAAPADVPAASTPSIAVPVATSLSTTPDSSGISADSFPVPSLRSSVTPAPRPMPILVTTVATPTVSSGPAFPVPAALSGRPTSSSRLQTIRIATVPQPLPVQGTIVRPSRSLPARLNRVLPLRTATAVPVPRPEQSRPVITNGMTLPQPAPGAAPKSIPATRAIPIVVPAPEARSIPVRSPVRSTMPTSTMPTVMAAATVQPMNNPGLLPVPNPNAPIGNVGRSPAVNVYRDSQPQSGFSGAVATNPTALGLHYRVVVETPDDGQQAQLRSLFPNAFRTSLKGRTVMQVGAFGDRAKADQLMQTLSSQGIRAAIETLE